jgi:lipopolysaccharide transport system permease protein
MTVLESCKNGVKRIPLLARPLRAARHHLRGLTLEGPVRIEARRGFPKLQLWELWQFRELLVLMACRDFQIRYKQTILGVLWAIVPTFLSGLVFTIFFGRIAKFPADGLPYAAFYFAAIVPWNFFAYILTQSSNCLTVHFHLLNKVYFPRLILPLKTILVATVDFLLACTLIAAVMIYYGLVPSSNMVWLPLFLMLAVMTGFGVGIWFAALNAYFRDLVNLLPYFTQIWFFLTTIFYSSTLLEHHSPLWGTLCVFNPMTCVTMGFRWSLYGVGPPPDCITALVFMLTALMTLGGMYFFRKVERTIADIV